MLRAGPFSARLASASRRSEVASDRGAISSRISSARFLGPADERLPLLTSVRQQGLDFRELFEPRARFSGHPHPVGGTIFEERAELVV